MIVDTMIKKIKNAKTETEALNISVANFGARSGAEMVKVLRNSANGADELKDKLSDKLNIQISKSNINHMFRKIIQISVV